MDKGTRFKGLGNLSLKMQAVEFDITVPPGQNVRQNLMLKIKKKLKRVLMKACKWVFHLSFWPIFWRRGTLMLKNLTSKELNVLHFWHYCLWPIQMLTRCGSADKIHNTTGLGNLNTVFQSCPVILRQINSFTLLWATLTRLHLLWATCPLKSSFQVPHKASHRLVLKKAHGAAAVMALQ